MSRQVYVLMWEAPAAEATEGDTRSRALFATTTRKRIAIRHARRLQADVYAIPYPGQGWDCPTIRATFDLLFSGGRS